MLCLKRGAGWKGKPEEVFLAYYLAYKSFERGENIAKTLDLEALLWLEKTKDIKSALEKQKQKEGENYRVVKCEEPNFTLAKADLCALEKIAVSRVIK